MDTSTNQGRDDGDGPQSPQKYRWHGWGRGKSQLSPHCDLSSIFRGLSQKTCCPFATLAAVRVSKIRWRLIRESSEG